MSTSNVFNVREFSLRFGVLLDAPANAIKYKSLDQIRSMNKAHHLPSTRVHSNKYAYYSLLQRQVCFHFWIDTVECLKALWYTRVPHSLRIYGIRNECHFWHPLISVSGRFNPLNRRSSLDNVDCLCVLFFSFVNVIRFLIRFLCVDHAALVWQGVYLVFWRLA